MLLLILLKSSYYNSLRNGLIASPCFKNVLFTYYGYVRAMCENVQSILFMVNDLTALQKRDLVLKNL